MEKGHSKRRAKRKRIRAIVWLTILILLLGIGGYFINKAHIIMNRPEDLFIVKNDANSDIAASPSLNGSTGSTAQQTDTASVQAGDDSDSASVVIDKNMVNILLLGVDRTPDGRTSSGTMAHADAVMVIAVNFANNEVNLVSLPRDSFVNMPAVKGFYKLNGMFNVGGGYESPINGGFEMMCDASKWLLGGIPIDYYYSVDFAAIVELVDAIGGVDYEMDMSYTGEAGTQYQTGMQHLDGQGVLDYLRARRNATQGASDRERVNRQKRMMIAIFNKIKSSNLFSTLPAVLNSVKGGFFTNTNIEQTLAIANFARNISADSIGTYSLFGEYKAGPISWNWTFVDPQNRIEIIQKVWGVSVSPLECTSYEFMTWLKDYGFLALKYKSTSEVIRDYTQAKPSLTAAQQTAYDDYISSYNVFLSAYNVASHSLATTDTSTMMTAQEDLRTKTQTLAQSLSYKDNLDWTVAASWCEDPGINEVYVDFR